MFPMLEELHATANPYHSDADEQNLVSMSHVDCHNIGHCGVVSFAQLTRDGRPTMDEISIAITSKMECNMNYRSTCMPRL